MDEEQDRLQKAAMDVLNDIDRKCLRTLHVNCLYFCKKNLKK